MTKPENLNFVALWSKPVQREVPGSAKGDHEFPQSGLCGAPDQGMVREYFNRTANCGYRGGA